MCNAYPSPHMFQDMYDTMTSTLIICLQTIRGDMHSSSRNVRTVHVTVNTTLAFTAFNVAFSAPLWAIDLHVVGSRHCGLRIKFNG